MSDELLTTPLCDWHAAHGGRMVDFAGWQMPVQYTSIVDEHHAVRRRAGLFDIAHMGRVKFTGPDAERFLDHVVTNDVTKIREGRIRYALVCNEQGGILDDVLVYRFPEFHYLVVNASNRPKILDWFEQRRSGFDVEIEDQTPSHFMCAVQGPHALEIANTLTEADLSALKYYAGCETRVLDHPGQASRTGYTGEDGVELIVPAEAGPQLWKGLLEAGEPAGLAPCGLGCRDTLRLEAAMPLYGHELSESIDPLTAGLDFAVKLDAGDFVGRDALRKIRDAGPSRTRIGLEFEGRRIARGGTPLFVGDRRVGEVTSGTFSPTLEKSIAMAYVEVDCVECGYTFEAEIRGKRLPGSEVPLPFYRRPS